MLNEIAANNDFERNGLSNMHCAFSDRIFVGGTDNDIPLCAVFLSDCTFLPKLRGLQKYGGKMHCKWWLGAALLSLMPLASAETLLVKANGYSWERENLRRFDAMLISDQGKVLALGAQSELAPRWPAARVIDLGGKTVLPGLTDAHGHLLSLGYSMMSLNLRDTRNLQEARDAIRAYVQQYPGNGWVQGGGWNQVVWQLGRFPEAADIDDLAPQRPVWLDRVDGHAGWANQAALRIAGIDKNTPDPAGGRIERDAAGNPTGVLIDSAMKLVSRHIPAADAAQNKR
jgi:predicted amidohydrolase YtcJ